MFKHINEWFLVSHLLFKSSTIHNTIIASVWDNDSKCWDYHILFIWINLLSYESFLCWFIVFDNMSMVSFFPDGIIYCKVSIFFTSIASKIWRISLSLVLFLILLLLAMKVLLILFLLEVLPSVNYERLIFSCSHLLLYYHELRFFLCTFFLEFDQRDQLPSCTNSLNE